MKSPRLFGIVFSRSAPPRRPTSPWSKNGRRRWGSCRLLSKVKGDKAAGRCHAAGHHHHRRENWRPDDSAQRQERPSCVSPAKGPRRWQRWPNPSSKKKRPSRPLPKPTGQKETISGYETEEYVSGSPKYHATYWVAKSYPNYESILRQMSLLQRGAFASIARDAGLPRSPRPAVCARRSRCPARLKSRARSNLSAFLRWPLRSSTFLPIIPR